MPQAAWSAKRERQYEHIEEGLEKRGTPKKKAKEIAARTVNKERARGRGARVVASVAHRRLVGTPRRAPVGDEPAEGPNARPALQRGAEPRDPGPLEDEQGSAPAGGGQEEGVARRSVGNLGA